MYNFKLTESETNNLLAFLTGKGRVQLTGDEAFEFVNIVHKLQSAEAVEERDPIEQIGIGESNSEEPE